MIAIVVVLSDSITSTVKSVKSRKSRKRLMTKSGIPYQQQQSVAGPLIVKVIHNYYSDDVHGVSFNNTPFIHRVTHLNLSNYDNSNSTSNHGENNPLPKERYVVYPKKYENFVSKKSTRRVNRNRRNITLSDTSDHAGLDCDNGNTTKVTKDKDTLSRNALRELVYRTTKIKNISGYMEDFKILSDKRRNLSNKRNINNSVTDCRSLTGLDCDNDDTRKVTKNKDKDKFSKNALREMIGYESTKIKKISGYMDGFKILLDERKNLSKRNINNSVTDCRFCDRDDTTERKINKTRKSYYDEYLLPRRNTSDYYAQRRAVMERYYARQREINARYANRTNDNNVRTNGNGWQSQSILESNVSLFGHRYPNKDTTGRDNTISHYHYPLSITIKPLYNNGTTVNNRIQINVNNSRDIVSGTKLNYKYDADLSQVKNNSNVVVRNVPDYYVTPTPCTNIPLSGTSVPKTRWKQRKNYTDNNETSVTDNVNHTSIVKPVNNVSTFHK